MSRRPVQHAKVASRYEGRHTKPRMSGSSTLIGTAAKAVPASLVVGAAGSAMVLSGTAASAASTAATVHADLAHGSANDLATLDAMALPATVSRGRHARPHSYEVIPGDTLSKISARFCGTAADYPSLAAASGIRNPNLIYVGQTVKLRCHAAATLTRHAAVGRHRDGDDRGTGRAPVQQAQTVSYTGPSAFETCVIARESGGNPHAVNPFSGAGGLFQFLPSTWAGLGYAAGYPGGAQTAPVSVQEDAFAKLYAEAGTSPWAPYDGC